jgi:hypothetical protein
MKERKKFNITKFYKFNHKKRIFILLKKKKQQKQDNCTFNEINKLDDFQNRNFVFEKYELYNNKQL